MHGSVRRSWPTVPCDDAAPLEHAAVPLDGMMIDVPVDEGAKGEGEKYEWARGDNRTRRHRRRRIAVASQERWSNA